MVRPGRSGIASYRLCQAGVALAAILLAACTATPPANAPLAGNPAPAKQTDTGMSPAVLREHQRILATYGGVYNDPRLQTVIEQMVERLVAASDKPDLHYKVTILNSQSINAFALPTGQLYVTRGLIALADDDSELASVIAHEMGHVIARHAELREKEEQQVDLVSRVVNDVVSDPEAGALALAKSKLELASFSQKQEFEADAIGIGIAARAGYDPYGAARFLTAMERNSELKPEQSGAINPAAPDFLSSHPSTPERVTQAIANARQYKAPASVSPAESEQARDAYFGDIDGIVYGEDPSEGFVRGRRFLHPKLGFTFTAPEGFTLDNTAQAVLGVKRGGGEALRLDVVRVPRRTDARAISHLGLDREHRSGNRRRRHHQRLPRRHRGRQGRSVGLPALCHPFRQRRLPLHLRRQTSHARHRPRLPRIRQYIPPHEPRRNRAGQAAADKDREGGARRYGGKAGGPDGRCRPRGRALPRAQWARARRPAEARQRGQDRRRMTLVYPAAFRLFSLGIASAMMPRKSRKRPS